MKLVINEQIIVTAQDDIVGNGLIVMLINAINQEPQPINNQFVMDTCNELALNYTEYENVSVVGHRPKTIRH